MKRQSISVSLAPELLEWLNRLEGPTMRRRSQTIEQFVRLAKQAYETGKTSADPVLGVAATNVRAAMYPGSFQGKPSQKVAGRDYGRHTIPFPNATGPHR